MLLDAYQTTAVTIGCIEVIFIGVYYNTYGEGSEMYVSDILFAVLPYKILMSIFVGLQSIMCFLFVCRVYSQSLFLFWAEVCSLVACIVGWATLNSKYLQADGETSDVHRYGTLVFMIGMISYFLLLVYTTKTVLMNIGRDFWPGFTVILILLLLLVTLTMGIIFIYCLFNDIPDGWIFEHTAFMTVVLATFSSSPSNHQTHTSHFHISELSIYQ